MSSCTDWRVWSIQRFRRGHLIAVGSALRLCRLSFLDLHVSPLLERHPGLNAMHLSSKLCCFSYGGATRSPQHNENVCSIHPLVFCPCCCNTPRRLVGEASVVGIKSCNQQCDSGKVEHWITQHVLQSRTVDIYKLDASKKK
jgi:hypothetical protein